MSGSTIGGVVGGAVGFYFGGPAGAQWGFAIGSAIGGYVDPEKVQGPRLTDAAQQTSTDGIPISWGYGRYPTRGNLIWIQPGPPTENKKTERQGKGGPKVTTYTYTRSYCIGICRGILRDDGLWDPIAGILVVKKFGKIVYDGRTDAELTALGMSATEIAGSRGASAAFLGTVRFHLGGESQLPDPTIEAWEGVGNTPAHRGLVNMVAIDHDVTETRGAIEQFEFVVSVGGTVEESCAEEANLLAHWPLDDAAPEGIARELVGNRFGMYSEGVSSGPSLNLYGGGSMEMDSNFQNMIVDGTGEGDLELSSIPEWSVSVWALCLDDTDTHGQQRVLGVAYSDLSGRYAWGIHLAGTNKMQPSGGFTNGAGTEFLAQDPNQMGEGVVKFITTTHTTADGGTQKIYVNGELKDTETGVGASTISVSYVQIGGDVAGAHGFIGYVQDLKLYDGALTAQQVMNNFLSSDSSDLYPIPDAPGFYVRRDGTVVGGCSDVITAPPIVLATVVADLFRRAGLSPDQYDVSELTDVLVGYRIASEGGIDAYLQPLMVGYFFDVADWDGVVHCVKRGGDSVMTLTMDDLAQRSGDAIEWERIQEAELLRKVTVGYIDPAANYSSTAQVYERRAGTIQAKGESSIGIPVVTDATSAAQMAEKRTNVAWAERDKCLISLPRKFTRLTATDVVTLIDSDSVAHRIRLMKKEDESGVLMFEAPKDRQSAYTGSVTGLTPNIPTPPVAALIGPTLAMFMNLPAMAEAHDEVGLYVAGRGLLPDWDGAAIDLSTDAGASYAEVGQILESSTIGYTTTDLSAWHSSEYPSIQTVTVWLPDAPASVDYETLLRYANRAAIQLDSGEWGILQYQTVVANGSNSYTLSGLLRGRYNTTPGVATAGANFVLLDSSVQFIRAERWMIGQSLTVRAVSFGTDPDAAGTETFVFTPAVSQTEWSPHYVIAERDVSDNITTSCIVRARLGTETTPFHSKYFTGVRFTYSDGVDSFSYDVTQAPTANTPTAEHEYTAAQQTIDFGSPPSALDVTVSGLNSITGAGPESEAVTV